MSSINKMLASTFTYGYMKALQDVAENDLLSKRCQGELNRLHASEMLKFALKDYEEQIVKRGKERRARLS